MIRPLESDLLCLNSFLVTLALKSWRVSLYILSWVREIAVKQDRFLPLAYWAARAPATEYWRSRMWWLMNAHSLYTLTDSPLWARGAAAGIWWLLLCTVVANYSTGSMRLHISAIHASACMYSDYSCGRCRRDGCYTGLSCHFHRHSSLFSWRTRQGSFYVALRFTSIYILKFTIKLSRCIW